MSYKQYIKPNSYMNELDTWTESTLINPLFAAWERQQQDQDVAAANEEVERVIDEVKKTLRAKVLESYRNGQNKQGQTPAKQPQRNWGRK